MGGNVMTTGEKLQNLRKENNYTQEELADILGVSRQSISKWESDSAFPETDKLITLSKLYHCTVDYLLNIENDDKMANDNVTSKHKEYNNKKLPFLITTLSVSLFTFIMFAVSWVVFSSATYDAWSTRITYYSSFYNIVFADNYKIGNVFALFSFFINLGITAVSIVYLFIDKKLFGFILKILNCVLLGMLIVFFVIVITGGAEFAAAPYIEIVILVALVVLQYVLKPFKTLE
jgi:transcriptional regulator with XRE-family HTH domain